MKKLLIGLTLLGLAGCAQQLPETYLCASPIHVYDMDNTVMLMAQNDKGFNLSIVLGPEIKKDESPLGPYTERFASIWFKPDVKDPKKPSLPCSIVDTPKFEDKK